MAKIWWSATYFLKWVYYYENVLQTKPQSFMENYRYNIYFMTIWTIRTFNCTVASQCQFSGTSLLCSIKAYRSSFQIHLYILGGKLKDKILMCMLFNCFRVLGSSHQRVMTLLGFPVKLWSKAYWECLLKD